MNDQMKEFFKRSFTIQCRILHPKLTTPESRDPNKPPKFGAMIVVPKQPLQQSFMEMQQFIDQAFNTFHAGINRQVLVNPIKDYNTYVRQDGKPNPDYTQGCYWLNASSGAKFPPVVIDMNRQQVLSEAEIWSGRNAAVSISFYNIDGSNGGKRGLGTNLNAVMLLDGGEKVVGSGGVDINQAFGNFQADMGLIQQGGQAPQPQMPVQGAGQPFPQQPAQQAAPQQAVPQQTYQPQQAVPQQQWAQQPAQPQQGQTVNNPFAPNPNNNPYV